MSKENLLISHSDYLAGKEALYIQVEMSDFLVDYYLHLKEFPHDVSPLHDELLKQLFACFAIHLTAHPPGDTFAWTLHMRSERPFTLFVTGSAAERFIVGLSSTENIRHTDINVLHSQRITRLGQSTKSMVRCETSEITEMVEHFYTQSEQRPIRIEVSKTSDTAVALAALPDFDEEWFHSVKLSSIETEFKGSLKRLKSCGFQFVCDCSPEKLLPYLRSVGREGLAELFGPDEEIYVSCPRCGRKFTVTRAEVEQVTN